MLNHLNANSCSQLVLKLPTWRSDNVEFNKPAWAAFYYFIPTRCHTQNKFSLITEFLITSKLSTYNFFLPQALLCLNSYIWFNSDQWMCSSLKPTGSSEFMNDSLMSNEAVMKGWWFSVYQNTLEPTFIVMLTIVCQFIIINKHMLWLKNSINNNEWILCGTWKKQNAIMCKWAVLTDGFVKCPWAHVAISF